MKFKAIIFDMDGVMIDSEPIQSKAYEIILRKLGKNPKIDKYGMVDYTIGLTEKNNWSLLKKRYGININVKKLMFERNKIYLHLLNYGIEPMKGFKKLFQILKRNGYKLAITSSSSKRHIDAVVKLFKIVNKFDLIISGALFRKPKPCPDIYIKTAKKLGVAAKSCLVIEDSQIGVEAAKHASMKVVAVPNFFTKGQSFSQADLVAESLEDKKILEFVGI